MATYEETIKALAERYDAQSALAEDGSLAIEVDDTPVSFRKANGEAVIVARGVPPATKEGLYLPNSLNNSALAN